MANLSPNTQADPDPKSPPAWRTRAIRAGILLLVMLGVIYAGHVGWEFRRWMWEITAPIRHTADIDRGFYWGRQAALEGYANQYEKMQPEQPHDLNWLDYGPLRLGVMTLWAKWAMIHYPQVKQWHQDRSFEFTAPVLWFNTFMESIGIVSAFFLTRLWARRGILLRRDLGDPPLVFFDGMIPGLLAGLILWFNPAIVLSAYGWPTWDLWVVPMFLLAALLASVDWWFTAGVIVGIGAMFKGQQLMSVPVFFIWAIIVGQPVRGLRMLVGVAIAIAIVASPWLLTYLPADKLAAARSYQEGRQPALAPAGIFAIPRLVDIGAIIWIIGVLLAAISMPFVARISPRPAPGKSPLWQNTLASDWLFPALSVIGCMLLVSWPWLPGRNRAHWVTGEIAGLALAALTRWARPRVVPLIATGAVATAMLLCMSVFHGSSAWYDCGIHFGTIHWPTLSVGQADNLPAILREHYEWSDDLATTAITLPAHSVWSLWNRADVDLAEGPLLRGVYLVLLTLSSIGIGLHARRRDPRFLIAIVTPWLMLFCFPPQIHERYLLFAAGISCVCTGISTGMTLLGMLLSIVTVLMTLHTMLSVTSRANLLELGVALNKQFPSLFDRQGGNLLLRIAEGTHPDLGFAVILIGFVFLYFTLALRKPNRDTGPRPVRATPIAKEIAITPIPIAPSSSAKRTL
jgi:hypothetical protein